MGFESEALIHKKVKNEDCSSLFIENKRSKKSAPHCLLKMNDLSRFNDKPLKVR